MKKKLLVLSVLALSGISTATLASCDKFAGSTTVTPSESIQKTVTGISVTGQNTEYGIGDSIVQGAGARVSVNYSDGSSSDSTATAKFDFSAVDASKAGKYTVKVTCQGKETSYEVEVKEYVFTGIEADTSKADLNYYLYSVYNFDDVVINALYKHPVTNEVTKKVLNNADVAFKVTDSNNTEIGTQFLAFGDYNVEASYNGAKCNFAVKCVTVDAKTIAEAMEVASKTESSIASGSAEYTTTYGIGKGNDETTYEKHTNYYNYVYGNSFVKTSNDTFKILADGTKGRQKRNLYYSLKSNGEPFVVAVDLDADGNETGSPYIPTDLEFNPEAIDTQYLPLNIFDDGTKYNGLYNTINRLYKDLDGVVGDPHQEVGECPHLDNANGFKFGYNRLRSAYGKWYYEKVTVEFTLTESGAINKAYIQIDKYVSDENPAYGEKDYEAGTPIPSDLPIEIKEGQDEAGLTKKYFVFKKDVEATPSDSSNWKFNQESGVKASDDENPYLASKITVSDFKIFDADGTELEDGKNVSLDLDTGNNVRDPEGSHKFIFNLSIGEVQPTTANIDLDQVAVSVSGTGKDGYVLGSGGTDSDYAYVSKSDNVMLIFNRPGEYDVTFKTSTVTKTIHYSVDYEAPLTIQGTVHNGEENSSFVPEGTFAMYKSNKIYIGANIGDNNGGNADVFEPGFTAVVDKATGLLEKTTLNVNGKDVECYAFTATEAGDYVITLTGAKPDSDRDAATTTLTITVEENPTLASILAKYDNKYEAVVSNEEMYSLVFTDNKFTVYNKYDHTKYAEYEYSYDDVTRTFSCIPGKSGIDKNFELSMSNYYVLSLVDTDTNASYILSGPTSDIKDEDWAALKGKYEATLGSTSYVFDFKQGDTKGEGSFTVTIGSNNYAYTYKYENETGKLLTSIAIDGNDPLSTFTLSVKNATITLSDGTNSANLISKAIDINEICKGTYTASFDNSGNGEYEYEITFNDDGTATLNNKNKKRERVCSYTYNEETGQLKFTKISGSSSSVGIESAIYVIDGQLTYNGFVVGGNPVFSRKGGNETPAVVEVPAEYIGTWYGIDSYDDSLVTVEISATTIKVTSEGVNGTFDVQAVKDNTVIAGKVTLLLGSNSISFDYNNYVSCTLSKEKPSTEVLEVPAELQGTYEGFNPNVDEKVTVVIGKTTIEYADGTYTISSIENGTYNFSYEDWNVQIVVDSNGTITLVDGETSIVIHVKGLSATVEIDESLQGTWKDTTNNITLVISASDVNWDGIKCSGVSYDEGYLMFTYDDIEYEGSYKPDTKLLEIRQSMNTNKWYSFSKQTSSDASADSTVSVLEDYQGTYSYYDKDYEYTTYLAVAANVIIYNGDEYSVKNVELDGGNYIVTASFMKGQQEVPLIITFTNSSALVDELEFTKQVSVTVSSGFIGHWICDENYYTVVDYAVYSGTSKQKYNLIIVSCNDNELVVTDGDETITLTLNSDGTLTDGLDTYTKSN